MERQKNIAKINEGVREYEDEYGGHQDVLREQEIELVRQRSVDFRQKLDTKKSSLEESLKISSDIYEKIKNVTEARKIVELFPDRKERMIAVDVLGALWKRRMEGVGVIREKLLNLLLENPDSSREEIFSEAISAGCNYDISEVVLREVLDPVLDNFMRRRELIRNTTSEDVLKLLKEYGYEFDNSITKIIKKVFDIEVQGKVIIDGSGEVNSQGGFTYKGQVFSVNMDGLESISLHEEQHNIHEMIPGENVVYLSHELEDSLKCAKDEILAFFRMADEYWEISVIHQLQPKGSYVKSNAYEKIWENLNVEDRDSYCNIVQQAVDVLVQMSEMYQNNRDKIIGMLQFIPLDQWSSYLRKLLKDRPNSPDGIRTEIKKIEEVKRKI